MPPKRGRSTTGRGRGSRGRGRGSPIATEDSARAESEDAKPNVEDLSSGDEVPSDPIAESETADDLNAALFDSRDAKPALDDASSSDQLPPNTSASQSVISSYTAPTDISPNTAAPSSNVKRPIAAPRGRRRNQAEREELQRAEDDRKRAAADTKTAEEAAKARREGKRRDDGRSRGSVRGRGRGGYMGERETETDASGAFGSGRVEKVASTRPARPAAPRTSTSGKAASKATPEEQSAESPATRASRSKKTVTADGMAVKQESTTDTTTRNIIKDNDGDAVMQGSSFVGFQDGGHISSSEDEDEKGTQRMNVEDIIDLTREDQFAPVRVARVAHRDRDLGINAEGATDREGAITIDANDPTTVPTSQQSKGKQRAREVEFVDEKVVFQATYSDSESEDQRVSQIKYEEPIPVGSRDTRIKDPPSSPETRRRAKARTTSNEPLTDGLDHQAQDDLEELRRYESDRQLLRNELGGQKADQDGDATMSNAQHGDKRAERMYLFQFPPVLPDLETVVVKPEPDVEVSLPNGNSEETEVDQKPITIPDEDSSQAKTRELPKLPSGAVGKLNVHASGRVTIDWGGTSLCLGLGTDANFLQDILVTSLPESKEAGAQRGVATSMGRCMGKFVVTPDWDEILR